MMKMNNDRAIPASSKSIHMVIPFSRDFTRFCARVRHIAHRVQPRPALFAAAALATLAALAGTGCATRSPAQPSNPAPAASTPTPAVSAGPQAPVAWQLEPGDFATLPGWRADDLTAAWPAFLQSCSALQARAGWREACGRAIQLATRSSPDTGAIRSFFESGFIPYRVRNSEGQDRGLVTGYYEPLLRGSRTPHAPFLTPLYGVPDDLISVDLADVYPELKGLRLRGRLQGHHLVPYPSRAEIAAGAAPRGKELVWVEDPITAFFLQVQGSGRIQLYEKGRAGAMIRMAYAEQNGRPYVSIGRWLADQGELPLEHVSMQNIQEWARLHPDRVQALLDVNPSYVFFKEQPLADARLGASGALGVPLTPGRSIAVDARIVPLGAPVFLATTQPNSDAVLERLTFAQDTGGAIQASPALPVRADLYWGFGDQAAEQAGRMKQQGRMWVLLPRGVAP